MDTTEILKYLKKAYEYAKTADQVSPTSIMIGLNVNVSYKYNETLNKYVEDVEEDLSRKGILIGESIGLSHDQIKAIVAYCSDRGYVLTGPGLSWFQFTTKGEDFIFNMEGHKTEKSSNSISILNNTGPVIINQASDNVKQVQNIQQTQNDLAKFFEILKSDLLNYNENIQLKEKLEEQIEFCEYQLTKGRNIVNNLLVIGYLIKDIGINVFANLIASPIYDFIKPFLGL